MNTESPWPASSPGRPSDRLGLARVSCCPEIQALNTAGREPVVVGLGIPLLPRPCPVAPHCLPMDRRTTRQGWIQLLSWAIIACVSLAAKFPLAANQWMIPGHRNTGRTWPWGWRPITEVPNYNEFRAPEAYRSCGNSRETGVQSEPLFWPHRQTTKDLGCPQGGRAQRKVAS